MGAPDRIDSVTSNTQPIAPNTVQRTSTDAVRTSDGKSFQDLLQTKLNREKSVSSAASAAPTRPVAVPDPVPGSSITWSAHAQARLKQRGIEFDTAKHTRLETAVDKAAAKGAKNALVLLDDTAMVLSVKNRTVITALGMHQAKENVFTNIDSAVIA